MKSDLGFVLLTVDNDLADAMSQTATEPSDAEYAEAFRLVGEFMFGWAHLESVLNRGVGRVLHMDSPLNQAILTANMSVREKLSVLRTALLLPVVKNSDEWVSLNKLMDRISNRADDRNTVAHTVFSPHPKGLIFHPVKAKREFSIPDIVWTAREFSDKRTDMTLLTADLQIAVEANVKLRRAPRNALAGLISPMTGPKGFGLLNTFSDASPSAAESSSPEDESRPA